MLPAATLGLCISLLTDLFPVGTGSRVDWATGARAELNAGRIPVTSIDDSEAGVEQTFVLRSGVRLISPTSSFSITYEPRYYLRLPDVLDVGRPLLLHQVGIGWAAALSRRVSLNWNVRSSAGELPNSGLLLVFEPGTGRVESSVIPLIQASTGFGMSAVTGKRQTTSLTLSANHSDSLRGEQALPPSDNLGAGLSHSVGWSRNTAVGISTGFGYAVPYSSASSATIGAQLFLNQRVRESATLRVGAGMSQGWVDGGDVSWPLPTVDVAYTSRIVTTGQSWGVNVSGGTRAFFDVASAIYRPQMFVAVGISGQILRTWTLGTSLNFSTDISGSTLGAQAQPTQMTFDVPITYRIATNFDLAFGLRVALSGPQVSDWGSGQFQDQFSLYLALDWGTGTEASRGGWL